VSFVASKPAISFINGVCYDFILLKKQFCELTPEVNRNVAANINGIQVKAFGLRHNAYYRNGIDMNESMLNVSFLFEMDGISIFHSGDIKTDALQGYLTYNSKWTDRIDVALLSYGLFESDEKDLDLIVSTLHPLYIVVMHVPAENIKTSEAKIEKLKSTFPDIVFLKNRMESKTLIIKEI
jgi:L-ascorbate metabolism protein UlaG (beta-lactamase superfamily)